MFWIQKFWLSSPSSAAGFTAALDKYDIDLRTLLHHPVGRQRFVDHLSDEYSRENIDFWQDAIAYEETFAQMATEKQV